MYYKLVEITDFDANEELYSTKAIIFVIMANNKQEAAKLFKYLKYANVIVYSSTDIIEIATKEEYEAFLDSLI